MIEPWAALTVLVACTVIVFLAGRWTAPWHPRAVRVVAHHLRLQPDDVVALEVQGPIDAATVELLRQEWARQQCHGKLVLVPGESAVQAITPSAAAMNVQEAIDKVLKIHWNSGRTLAEQSRNRSALANMAPTLALWAKQVMPLVEASADFVVAEGAEKRKALAVLRAAAYMVQYPPGFEPQTPELNHVKNVVPLIEAAEELQKSLAEANKQFDEAPRGEKTNKAFENHRQAQQRLIDAAIHFKTEDSKLTPTRG